MPKVDHVFWGVAEDRNPVAATLPHNTILVVIPPPSFGRPLWRVQTWVAPPPTHRLRYSPECVEGRFSEVEIQLPVWFAPIGMGEPGGARSNAY